MKIKKINSNLLLIILGLIIGLLNGIFGSGGGIIAVLLMTFILKLENKIAHATSISIILIKNGYYDVNLLLKVGIGSIFGGVIGAKLLSKISNSLLRRIFGVVMIISAVRMIL